MNFTENFDQFSSRLSTMDLALYAGIGMVLWVMFKDKLSPVQKIVGDLFSTVTKKTHDIATGTVENPVIENNIGCDDSTFFNLIVSWKKTRDLAEKSGCSEAVKAADQMFPFLSPNICKKDKV